MLKVESDHVLDEDVIVEGADIDRIYYGCLGWLKDIKAKIKEKGDDYISAEHKGSVRYQGWWFRDKTITITLKKLNENVHVRIVMNPIYGKFQQKGLGIKPMKRYWVDFIVHFWTYIGFNVDKKMLCSLYSCSDLKTRINNLRYVFIILMIMVFLPFTGIFFFYKIDGFVVVLFLIIFSYFYIVRVFIEADRILGS